tara:strand:- start:182 stop:877 length:696 start_codon:yes stop_codon:yes gene_type:complete
MKKFILNNSFFYYIYKIIKILRNSKKNIHLGEFGEDIFIRRFFKSFKNGFYVDIGCYHPVKGSLTNYLYINGWKGLNVDLSQISIDLFKISRPKDINVRAAISDFDGETMYFENGPINQQNSLDGKNANKIKIKSYKINTLLKKYNIEKIDFLNIDAEGHDFKVIADFNFSKYHPKLISIEYNSYNLNDLLDSNLHKLLVKNEYFMASKFGVTCIYIKIEFKDKMQSLMSI